MADINPTVTPKSGLTVVSWKTLTSSNANGASYQPIRMRFVAAAVQVTGTFDSATVVMQGSNDGTNWETLLDTNGASISFTSAGFAELSTSFLYVRPSTSGGSGSQDIDVIVCARG